MVIRENYNLSSLNTFGLNVKAKFFAEVNDESDLGDLLNDPVFKENKKFFLGGGSNTLFTGDFDGIVVLNKLKGIEILLETDESVLIKAFGGEVWHDLVTFAVERGYWGIENLALIPGSVGAAPMQNIGAYGAELKDTLKTVEAYDMDSGEKRIFSSVECQLGYRESIFKKGGEYKKYFISAITLELSKIAAPNTEYKILSDYLLANNIKVTGPKDISEAVSNIRRSKLPDPKVIGNAGSFFKNVFISPEKFLELQNKFPELPHFEEDRAIKVPAGWLIEHCGPSAGVSWKGARIGNVGVHDKQALVLVNHGGATGAELLALAKSIIASVKEKFGLELTPEVNIV